jgi:uncharacterized membrane protein YdbT with pleckstrin-like domain
MSEETSLWKGSPSQWLNLGPITITLVIAAAIVVGGFFFPPAWIALVLPLAYLSWQFLAVRCQVYELTTERLRLTAGVINQKIDEVELYRVKDSVMERSWWMRITGLASISIETSDRSLPKILIPAIHGGTEFRELLRKQVEMQRDRKRVREMDFDETANAEGPGDDALA